MRADDTALRHSAWHFAPVGKSVVVGAALEAVRQKVFYPAHCFNRQLKIDDGRDDDIVKQLVERFSEALLYLHY